MMAESSGPEVFLGLVGAVGTNLENVCSVLQEAFGEVGYQTHTVKLSSILDEVYPDENLQKNFLDEHIDVHMTAGDKLRESQKRGDILAALSLYRIRRQRAKVSGAGVSVAPRQAYILSSLKHPDEVRFLRKTYNLSFTLLSAYSPKSLRFDTLASKIAHSRHDAHSERYTSKADELIKRDEEEAGKILGQNVRATFPKADVFVDVGDPARMTGSIKRFIEILFAYPYHTPTHDEYAMFHAKAGALRTASMARQVGAVVTNHDGDIVAVGTNEVPKAGGGMYWSDQSPDYRDFRLGHDESDRMRRNVLIDVLNRLKDNNWLEQGKKDLPFEKLVEEAVGVMKDADVMKLIEFGRAQHAEMAAMLNAAYRGVSVADCTLYTTTFPCHDCARHIVAAGIRRLVYIEPYPKSYAIRFHQDSISVDEPGTNSQHVTFESFVGVSPRRFIRYFSWDNRKNSDGSVMRWEKSNAKPRFAYPSETYIRNEGEELSILDKEFERLNLVQKPEKDN